MMTCPDRRFINCQCKDCAHGGCCLRAEHSGILCPILDCPDFRPPVPRPAAPAAAPAAVAQTQMKLIVRTAEEAFQLMASIFGPDWRTSYIPAADDPR